MNTTKLIEALQDVSSKYNRDQIIRWFNDTDTDYMGKTDIEMYIIYLQAHLEEEEQSPEEWLEFHSESIGRNVFAIDDMDEHICTFDNDTTVHGQRMGIMEIVLTQPEYDMLNEEQMQEDMEMLVKAQMKDYEVNVSMCDDDKSVCITIEEPDFTR